jgi:indole-3-glycerol phosphate synthase
VLGRIVTEARARAAELNGTAGLVAELERAVMAAPPVPSFVHALRGDTVAVIAEVKRRSPSKGEINGEISAASQASAFARGGAAAISVLTEPIHFGGTLTDIEEARRAATLPILRKDFLVDEVQLLEARCAGASAALLIARALAPEELGRLATFARGLGLEPLVEVRSEAELERALASEARVVGVNTRDLETLAMEPEVRDRLIPLIPAACIAVAESGILSVGDVQWAAELGADAVLVGSSLSAASDPADAVRALAGVRRSGREG